MVDENGRPLLLGHATRNFGFNKFNTNFIHLSTIDDASCFSGGNKRMFKDKEILNKLDDEEILDLYNKYFAFNKREQYHYITPEMAQIIQQQYENHIQEFSNPEYLTKFKRFGFKEQDIEIEKECYKIFLDTANQNGSIYFGDERGLAELSPHKLNNPSIENWQKIYLPTINDVRYELENRMFEEDRYEGRGGTYPLCARVLKPLHVNCNGNAWDEIYLKPNSCEAYSEIYDIYCKEGWNTSHLPKGGYFPLDNESIADCAQQLGYDGVVFHNIREGALGNWRMDTTYIVFSTKQLKSPFENSGEFGDVEDLFG